MLERPFTYLRDPTLPYVTDGLRRVMTPCLPQTMRAFTSDGPVRYVSWQQASPAEPSACRISSTRPSKMSSCPSLGRTKPSSKYTTALK